MAADAPGEAGPDACQPRCNYSPCGDDGRGGSCGECAAGYFCADPWAEDHYDCYPDCQTACQEEDRHCGVPAGIDDYCFAADDEELCSYCSCGQCGAGMVCTTGGGVTGTGGSCVSKADSCAFGEGGYAVCAADEECTAEGCVKCAEACQAMECGKNPCGGLCGSCPEHFECQLGKCVYLPWCGDFKCNAPAVEDCESCPADCACDAGSVCVAGECCVQQCGSNECGPDGCGGTCGANCGAGMVCLKGTCSAAGATCDLLPIAGCCDGEKLAYCDNGILKTLDCTGYPKCGWHQILGWYECNTDGQPDPTGEYPMSCT